MDSYLQRCQMEVQSNWNQDKDEVIRMNVLSNPSSEGCSRWQRFKVRLFVCVLTPGQELDALCGNEASRTRHWCCWCWCDIGGGAGGPLTTQV